MAMLRHQLENGKHRYRNVATSQQYGRDISCRREGLNRLNVVTSKHCLDISQSLNTGDHHVQCRIGNVMTFNESSLSDETSLM